MAGILIIIFTIIMVWCFDNPVLDSTVGDILSDNMLSDKTTPGDPKHMKDLQQAQGAAGAQGAQGARGGFGQPQPQMGMPVGFPMQPSSFPQPGIGFSSQPSIGGGFPMQQPQQMQAQQPGGSWASLKVGDFLGGICIVVLIVCLGTCIFS